MTAQSERATEWRDLGRGTGKRPDGVSDYDVVQGFDQETGGHILPNVAKQSSWRPEVEYQLLVRTPAGPDVLRKALERIARQKLWSEFDEDEIECCDFESAYDTIVKIARKALAATEPTKEVM